MRKEQLQRYSRYIRSYVRHITPKKLLNLLQVEYRFSRGITTLKGLHPYFLIVEISNGCNLKCPLCQMGKREHISRVNKMSAAQYRTLIEPLAPYLFQVLLYDWGEPFLNKEIYEIIAINTSLNIGTVVSSNLNLPIDANRLVQSGLEHLVVSADGHTQEIYSKYRIGGNLESVVQNLKQIAHTKKNLKHPLPHIEWQTLVTRHTESYLNEIKNFAIDNGADSVRFANLNFFSSNNRNDDSREWLPTNPTYRSFEDQGDQSKKIRKPCFWLWRTAIINTDGSVVPCCLFDTKGWGDAFSESLDSIRNNELFLEARNRSTPGSIKKSTLICDQCNADFIFKKSTR